jgi:hypothetical protein
VPKAGGYLYKRGDTYWGRVVLPDTSIEAAYERLIHGKRPNGSRRGGSRLNARLWAIRTLLHGKRPF